MVTNAAKRLPGPSLKPKKFGILRLDKKKKFPASVLPAKVFDRCSPETVKIGTVYDNGDLGGFAGGKPVNQMENFRCAFNRAQGKAGELGVRSRSLRGKSYINLYRFAKLGPWLLTRL